VDKRWQKPYYWYWSKAEQKKYNIGKSKKHKKNKKSQFKQNNIEKKKKFDSDKDNNKKYICMYVYIKYYIKSRKWRKWWLWRQKALKNVNVVTKMIEMMKKKVYFLE
jgi:hypothetical protein